MNAPQYGPGAIVIESAFPTGFGVVVEVRGDRRVVDWLGRYGRQTETVLAERLQLAWCQHCDDRPVAVAYTEFADGFRHALCSDHATQAAARGLQVTHPGGVA